jgi:hypothetical protein
MILIIHMPSKKVKQSHYRPGQTLRVPEVWGSQISRQLVHEVGKVITTHRSPFPLKEIFLLLIYIRSISEVINPVLYTHIFQTHLTISLLGTNKPKRWNNRRCERSENVYCICNIVSWQSTYVSCFRTRTRIKVILLFAQRRNIGNNVDSSTTEQCRLFDNWTM